MGRALHPVTKLPITPKQFIAEFGPNYQERGIYPTCIYCGSNVFTYGVHSVNVTSRFMHFEGDSCIEDNSGYNNFDDYDFDQFNRIKSEFCEATNLKKAYAFCLKCCGVGNLTTDKFLSLCTKANKKNIWAYKNIQVWMIPYILLTLDDFEAKTHNGPTPTYMFRFVLDKTIKDMITNFFHDDKLSCKIQKIFADSRKLIKEFELLKSDFDDIEITWINDSTLKKLGKCCQ